MIDTVLLKEKAAFFGVELDKKALERYDRYAQMLVETNKVMNLTAITDPTEIVIKHFADSLSLLKYAALPFGSTVADVGTGAGFPGVALLIARPDLELTLIDSLNKRLVFLENVLKTLDLKAKTVHLRAEQAGTDKTYREAFDFAVSRAVAALPVLCEYCIPLIKVGGEFVAMKASGAGEEIKASENALNTLGGSLVSAKSFDLFGCGERNIIRIKKISQTPTRYPRASAKISQKSL